MTHINPRQGQALRSIGKALFWIGVVGASAALGLRSALPGPTLMAIVWVLVIVTFIGIAIMHRGRKLLATSGDTRLATTRASRLSFGSFAADHWQRSFWPL